MAEGDEIYLESSLMKEFRRVLQEDMGIKGMNKTNYGKSLKYLAQPGFNKIINGKALPGLRALIEITDELGYEVVLIRKAAQNTDE